MSLKIYARAFGITAFILSSCQGNFLSQQTKANLGSNTSAAAKEPAGKCYLDQFNIVGGNFGQLQILTAANHALVYGLEASESTDKGNSIFLAMKALNDSGTCNFNIAKSQLCNRDELGTGHRITVGTKVWARWMTPVDADSLIKTLQKEEICPSEVEGTRNHMMKITQENMLTPGLFRLTTGNYLLSKNGRYFATSKTNGSFAIFKKDPSSPPSPENGKILWETGAVPLEPQDMVDGIEHDQYSSLSLDSQCNLSLVVGNDKVWSSESPAFDGNCSMDLTNDGNLVIYKEKKAKVKKSLWSSAQKAL